MNKQEFKEVVLKYSDDMLRKWFPTKDIQDVLCKSVGKSIIKANIEKYDGTLDLFTDARGCVLVDDILSNVIEEFEGYEVDLDSFNIPFLPHRILLVSKADLMLLKNMIMKKPIT